MIEFQNLSFWAKESFILHSYFVIVGSGIVGLSITVYLEQREKNKKVTTLKRGFLPIDASTKNVSFSFLSSPSELLRDLGKNSEEIFFGAVERKWWGSAKINELFGSEQIGFKSNDSYKLFDDNTVDIYEDCIAKMEFLNAEPRQIKDIDQVFAPADNICERSSCFLRFNRAISNGVKGEIDKGKMMKALLGLAKSIAINILNGIGVKEVSKKNLETNCGVIPFQKLIICTYRSSQHFFLHLEVLPARDLVIVTSEIQNLGLKGIFHFDEGFYYSRNIEDRVPLGRRNLDLTSEQTEELTTTDTIILHLTDLLFGRIIPYVDFQIEHQWARTIGVEEKKEPIIEKIEDNIYFGIRLGGMGAAIGSLVRKELANLILEN